MAKPRKTAAKKNVGRPKCGFVEPEEKQAAGASNSTAKTAVVDNNVERRKRVFVESEEKDKVSSSPVKTKRPKRGIVESEEADGALNSTARTAVVDNNVERPKCVVESEEKDREFVSSPARTAEAEKMRADREFQAIFASFMAGDESDDILATAEIAGFGRP